MSKKKSAKDDGAGKKDKLSNKEYEKALYDLQVELCKVQEWVKATKTKICVVFEGRGVGKGRGNKK